MNVVRRIEEPYVVAKFLEAELLSNRFGPEVKAALAQLNSSEDLVTAPNLEDEKQNRLRAEVLGAYRGWRRGQLLFHNFPDSIDWYVVELSPSEIEELKFINYSYWLGISGGSLLVGDAADGIRGGKVVFGKSNQPFFDAAKKIESGEMFPEIILVAEDEDEDATPVILEGHLRATAYALAKKKPDLIKAILGISPSIRDWSSQNFG